MSDLDSLLLTFQTQFSVVMETVLKTAMYEVTRLVEDGFIEEVRRRDQKVDSLRTQLQWATRRGRGRCVDCGKVDVEMSPPNDTPTELQYSVLSGCDLKQEDGSMDRWAGGGAQEVTSEATQEADEPMAILSPEHELGAIEEESVRARLDVKEEKEVLKQSCSIEHSGGWAVGHDGGAGSESSSFGENNKTAQRNNEEILRAVMKQDLQTSITYGLTDVLEDTQSPSQDETETSGDIDCQRATLNLMKTGLIQNQCLGSSKECESTVIRSSPQQISHDPVDPIVDVLKAAHGNLPLVRCSSSESPNTRPQISDIGSVMIKQEIIVDSDEGDEEEDVTEEKVTRQAMAPSSCSINQYRVRPEALKHKLISHKPAVHEGMKLHSKVGTSLSLETATPHSHQPIRKLPHIPTTNTSTAPSTTHSQPANFHPFNRTPSISKPIPPLPVSLQRAHLSDKRPAALTRASVPWVSVKSHHQAANSFHPHPGSHPHPGPRHLLRCGQCGKCFPHPSNLKAHEQTHTGERPFCCSLCGRSFTKLSNLKAHRRVHTGERPYCCAACGKRFTQKCNLKRHQRIHLDV